MQEDDVNLIKTQGTVLSVDDDPCILQLIEYYLTDCGFNVDVAYDVEKALELFQQNKPDVVLSDLKMPTIGGLTFIKALKKISPETPVIIISGSGDMTDAIEALRLGAYDYIIKPFTQDQLEHVVRRAQEHTNLIKENKKHRQELEKTNIQLAQSLSQLKEDLDAGRSVQQQLLPKPNFHLGNYSLSHLVIPSLYLSGDFVDYFKINDHTLGFYIADVSGHGASSAFVTVLLKALVEQMVANYQIGHNDKILHPDKVLKTINDEILNAKLGKYLTMMYFVLNTKENSLVYSVGGHYPSPILYDGHKTIFLKGSGFGVGMVKEAKFNNFYYELPEKFSMVMFSDGVFEILHGHNLEENENKLLSLFQHSPIKIEHITEFLQLENETTLPDDITLLIINKAKSESCSISAQNRV